LPEPLGEFSLIVGDSPHTESREYPPIVAAKGALDSAKHIDSIVVRDHDDGPQLGRIRVGVDLTVVRPATRTVVYPVATQLGRHDTARCTGVGSRLQFQLDIDGNRFSAHARILPAWDRGRHSPIGRSVRAVQGLKPPGAQKKSSTLVLLVGLDRD
jgi:hypothetical protein